MKRRFTDKEIQIIRARIQNGESIYSLAKEYNVPYSLVFQIHKKYTYKEEIPSPEDWISVVELAQKIGIATTTLRKWANSNQIDLSKKNSVFYLERKSAQQFLDAITQKILLPKAASEIHLPYRRLIRFKNTQKITVFQIGSRYFVDIDQLRSELKQQDDTVILGAKLEEIWIEETQNNETQNNETQNDTTKNLNKTWNEDPFWTRDSQKKPTAEIWFEDI